MSIAVVARGTVLSLNDCGADEELGEGDLFAFKLGCSAFGLYRGREYDIKELPVVDVCLREDLAQAGRAQLAVDQQVVVMGDLRFGYPMMETYNEMELVTASIEAAAIGVDIVGMPGRAS